MLINNNIQQEIKFKKIIIFGIGLLGGSLALGLKLSGICNNIIGIDINLNNLQIALKKNAINKGFENFDKDMIFNADLIILCTPMLTYKDILKGISTYLNKDVIITDIGSTKRNVIKNFFELVPISIIPNCVATHPIAGSEKSGAEYIDYNLFNGKKVFITAHERQNKLSLIKIKQLWNKLGAVTYSIDYNDHDFIFSCVSHFPHILSFIYSNQIYNLNNNLINYAGSSFSDFTRIASSTSQVWIDIFFENIDLLLPLIEEFSIKLADFKEMLINKDRSKLEEFILFANKLRDEFINKI